MDCVGVNPDVSFDPAQFENPGNELVKFHEDAPNGGNGRLVPLLEIIPNKRLRQEPAPEITRTIARSKAQKRPGRKVWIEVDLLLSEAWRSLSNSAKRVLGILWTRRRMVKTPRKKGKKADWTISNNGEITFTYAEAESLGINRATFSKSLDELVEKGFIDVTRPGIAACRIPTLFALSDRWKKWGEPDFKKVVRPKNLFFRPRGWQNRKGKKNV